MIDVFFTVDVEIWCDGWHGIDEKFPEAFRKYIAGETSQGNYGVAYAARTLSDHGLTGVFFVEPLFSARFGQQALADIAGPIVESGTHEVQLHLHTEWVDEARTPLLENTTGKRQHLRYFSLDEQTRLIGAGARMLHEAGVSKIDAFRAGSFAFNRDTLSALSANDIPIDSSYNASQFGLDSGVYPGQPLVEPIECGGVFEYPMTVFDDGTSALRHAQLTACSYSEMTGLLWQALERGYRSFVILSHGSELLNPAKTRPDPAVVKRFHKLCAFLARHPECFRVRGFRDLEPVEVPNQPPLLTSPLWKTGARMLQQAYRKVYQ